ncbi:MAG: hypothetical protein ABEJ30_02845 [Halorientalis sp.]
MSREEGVWHLVGYVRSSQYRDDTLCYLFDEGPSMPSEIASGTDHVLPHVSRALSELREEGAVEVLVPEETQRGRIYGLSATGEAVAEQHLGDDALSVTRLSVDAFPHPEVVQYAQTVAREGLRTVAYRTGRQVAVVHGAELGVGEAATDRVDADGGGAEGDGPDGAGDADQNEDDVDRHAVLVGARAGRAWHAGADAEYVASGFADRTVVQLLLGDCERLGGAVDPSVELPVPEFPRACRDRLD